MYITCYTQIYVNAKCDNQPSLLTETLQAFNSPNLSKSLKNYNPRNSINLQNLFKSTII